MEAWFCKACGTLMSRDEATEGRCCQRPRRRDCPLRNPPANDNAPARPGLVAMGTIDDGRQGELLWRSTD